MPISEIIESITEKAKHIPFIWRKDKRELEISRIFGTETKKQGIFPNAFQNYKKEVMKAFPFYTGRNKILTRDICDNVVEKAEDEDPPYASITPPPEETEAPVNAVSDNCES